MSYSEDLEARLAELQARQHVMKQLLASAGWRDVVGICEGAITTRRQSAFVTMGSIRGMEDCVTLARLGAEVAGMQFVLSLPHILLKDLEQDIQKVVVERRETEENG